MSPRDSNREVELGRARFVTHARSLFSRRHIHHDQQQQQYPSSGTRTFDGQRSGPQLRRDVSRHHRHWNTGSTAQLALYKHDWRCSLPLKHFLCMSTLSTVPGKSVALTRRSLLCADLVRTTASTTHSCPWVALTMGWVGSGPPQHKY